MTITLFTKNTSSLDRVRWTSTLEDICQCEGNIPLTRVKKHMHEHCVKFDQMDENSRYFLVLLCFYVDNPANHSHFEVDFRGPVFMECTRGNVNVPPKP